MNELSFDFARPGLLVSVRDAEEARTALLAGADVIDVKEPNRGPLGAADFAEIAAIVGVVQSRVPVTAAMGELLEEFANAKEGVNGSLIPRGVSLFKFGLAGCGRVDDWQVRWAEVVSSLMQDSRTAQARPVAVVYADWQAADAPEPDEVLQPAIELGCPALLVDTWDKSAGGLFTHWSPESLHDFVRQVQRHRVMVVLAGALAGEQLRHAVALGPDLIAVRGAACETSRNSAVSFDRVRCLKQLLAASASPETTSR